MKDIMRKFQKNMAAATFAEAGEWDTAKEMAPEIELSKEATWLDKIFTAITFAESGLHDVAIHTLEPAIARNRGFNSALADDLGLSGIQLMYGTVSI